MAREFGVIGVNVFGRKPRRAHYVDPVADPGFTTKGVGVGTGHATGPGGGNHPGRLSC